MLLLMVAGCQGPNPAYRRLPMADAASRVDSGVADAAVASDRTVASDANPTEDAMTVDDAPPSPAEAPPLDTGPPADAALEVTPDAASDPREPDLAPGAAAVERSVMVTAGGSTAVLGGTGGTRYADDCGMGVLVGYLGSSDLSVGPPNNPYAVGIQAVCAELRVPAGSTVVVTGPSFQLPRRGRVGEVDWQALCPANQVMVGFIGRSDIKMVENFQFRCAPLTVTTAGVVIGAATALPWSGARNAGSDMNAPCPAGQVGRGHVVHVGSWIDRYGMVCGSPSVAP